MTVDSAPRTSATLASLALAGRLLTLWRRHPLIPMQSLLLPTVLLLVYYLVVSESMVRLTGADNLTALTPMCTLAGALMGALGAGFQLPAERDSGLLSRFWVMPVPRSSFVAGILLAEAARTVGAGAILLGIAMALGLRFDGGPVALIAFLSIPVLVVVVFAIIVVTVAMSTRSAALLTLLGVSACGLAFCTGGVAPVELFPAWLQPAIRMQPLTPVVDAMRALAEGEPAGRSLLLSAGWLIGLAAVFGPLAVRGYRNAAETGGSG